MSFDCPVVELLASGVVKLDYFRPPKISANGSKASWSAQSRIGLFGIPVFSNIPALKPSLRLDLSEGAPESIVGHIIGASGVHLKRIESETNTFIRFDAKDRDSIIIHIRAGAEIDGIDTDELLDLAKVSCQILEVLKSTYMLTTMAMDCTLSRRRFYDRRLRSVTISGTP